MLLQRGDLLGRQGAQRVLYQQRTYVT